jgi:hypothetical protein
VNEDKREILDKLRAEYASWEATLAGLSEAQATRSYVEGVSLKDELAHLWAWQQISRAHVRAAVQGRTPAYPTWPTQIVPGDEGDLDAINAWIQTTYGDQSWARIYADWRAGFQDFLVLIEAVDADALFAPGHYAWLNGFRLVDVLIGSYEHHQEHREELLVRLDADRAS